MIFCLICDREIWDLIIKSLENRLEIAKDNQDVKFPRFTSLNQYKHA